MEQTARRPLTVALTLNLVLALLLRFLVTLYPNLHMLQSHLFALLPVALMLPVLRVSAVRREKGLLLCGCLAVWTAVTCLFPEYVDSDLYTVLTPFFLTMAFLFVTCYAMPFAVGQDGARTGLHAAIAAFVFPMTALCCVGVYAALMGITIPSPAGAGHMPACVLDHRLSLFCSSVATGSYACLAVFLCALRLMDRPRPLICVLYGLCIPIAYVAAALSDARIPIVCASVCLGGLAWLVATKRLPGKRGVVRTAISFCIAGAVILLLYFGTGLCIRGANAVSARIAARGVPTATARVETSAQPADAPASESPAAKTQTEAAPAADTPAEPTQPASTEMTKRPLLYRISSLNGRTDVWKSAIELFRHEPGKLVTGTSPVFIIRDTQPYLSPDAMNPVYPHMHSLPFQTVTALGVPGLLLYAALIAYICVHALRVFFLGAEKLTLFMRGVALIPLFYTVMDAVDISLWFAPPSSFTALWFYLAGGYAVYLSKTYIPGKRKATGLAAGCKKGANA